MSSLERIVDDFVGYLNEVVSNEDNRIAVEALLANQMRMLEPTPAVTDVDGMMSAMGLVNGWFNRHGPERIAAVYDDKTMKLTGFAKVMPEQYLPRQ